MGFVKREENKDFVKKLTEKEINEIFQTLEQTKED